MRSRDFPAAALTPFHIVAEHPDAFLLRLLHHNEAQAVAVFRELCGDHKNPPRTLSEVTAIMKRQGLTASADALDNILAHRGDNNL